MDKAFSLKLQAPVNVDIPMHRFTPAALSSLQTIGNYLNVQTEIGCINYGWTHIMNGVLCSCNKRIRQIAYNDIKCFPEYIVKKAKCSSGLEDLDP